MTEHLLIKRYNAYYHGWCLAFGEHKAVYDEERVVCWLFGVDKIGMALAPRLRRRLYMALLGRHERAPELILENSSVRVDDASYDLTDSVDIESMERLKQFLTEEDELHLYLTSHFCYPAGTRIITFARKKPSMILYKEMQPLKLIID